jgi:hypothetical protein
MSKKTMALVALCATTALAGCGSKDKDTPTPTAAASTPTFPADTPTPTGPSPADAPGASPTVKWAKATCAKLVGAQKAVQPPQVSPSTPDDTKKSLTTFFGQLSDQLGAQADVLKEAGAPPGPNGRKAYAAALAKLAVVQAKVDKVQAQVKSSDAGSEKEMQVLIASLGKTLESMASYEGPISELMATRSLGDALSAEPACAAFGRAGQSTS